MGQIVVDFTKSSIVKVCNNKELFRKELIKASKVLSSHDKECLINWLYFFTADKPEVQKWFWEFLDKKILVS